MEKRYQYRGDLAQTALPEMLYTIDHYRVPGVMQVIRNDVVKRIYIKDGNMVHASSSDIRDSLGYYLLQIGMLSKQDFRVTMRARRNSETRYGELLVERGLLSPAKLYDSIRQQIEEVVWSLFSWEEGQATFSIGEFHDPSRISIQLPIHKVIKEGVKRTPNAKRLLARVGKRGSILEAQYKIDDLIRVALTGEEYELLRLVDGKKTLEDLCNEGPLDSVDNGKLLYAYCVLKFVRVVGVAEPTGVVKIRMRTEGDSFSS